MKATYSSGRNGAWRVIAILALVFIASLNKESQLYVSITSKCALCVSKECVVYFHVLRALFVCSWTHLWAFEKQPANIEGTGTRTIQLFPKCCCLRFDVFHYHATIRVCSLCSSYVPVRVNSFSYFRMAHPLNL